MKTFKILGIILLILWAALPDAHAMKMNIDPARVEVDVKAGDDKTGSVSILNYDEEKPIRVKAYVQDVVYLPDGSNDFMALGSTPWTLADWIKIGPVEFEVPPGKQETVRYVISVPEKASGGHYGVIFFETVPSPSEFKAVGATVNFRIGTIVLVTVDGTSKVSAKLTGLTVKPPQESGQQAQITWTVYNGGNVIVRPFGTAKIIDSAKKEVAKIELNNMKEGIFPNTNREFSMKCGQTLPKGSYYVQIVLDYGGDVLLGGQSRFEIM